MWYAVDVTPAAQAREAVEYALMEAGANGTEVRRDDGETVSVAAYFDAPPEMERVRAALADALAIYGLAPQDAGEPELREVADADWLAEWKKNWRPVEVGERFLIAPPWSETPAVQQRIVIRIEPGMAFGTGTHETTRLCLAAVEKHFKSGSFLDVGTGTGILAIAAAKLCETAVVEACDTDALAVTIAHENARLNGVAERINFRVGTVDDDDSSSAAVVCANLTADVIIPLLPALLRVTCGRLILSGILAAQSELVNARLSELGVTAIEITGEGEWVAMVVRHDSP